jgi:hypothetical protein
MISNHSRRVMMADKGRLARRRIVVMSIFGAKGAHVKALRLLRFIDVSVNFWRTGPANENVTEERLPNEARYLLAGRAWRAGPRG